MMTKCPRCKSEALEPQMIRYSQEYEGHFYIIEKAPVHVCAQCGEIILSESVGESIQRKIWSGAQPKRMEKVPVYEIAASVS